MATRPEHLGVPEMDTEHLEIAALFDSFAGLGDADLSDALDRADMALRDHFAHEEALMERHQVPVLFCHIAQHKKLLAEFDAARADASRADWPALRRRLTVILPELILGHVASVDRVTSMWILGQFRTDDLDGLRLPVPAPA
jgi:hemerythrin